MDAFRKLSASGLDVAAKCPASFALSAVDTGSSADATAGTARHRCLDEFADLWNENGHDVEAARAAALAAEEIRSPGAAWLETLRAIDYEALVRTVNGPATKIMVGRAYALHPHDREVHDLGRVPGRSYEYGHQWVCGTYDWIMFDETDTPTLLDFKGSMRTTPVRNNLQIGFYSACAAMAHGFEAMNVELRYINDDGTIQYDRAYFDQIDFAWATQRIRRVLEEVTEARAAVAAGLDPRMSVGTQCSWCPCLAVCPAQTRSIRDLVGRDPHSFVELEAEAAGEAWVQLKVGTEFIERVKRSIDERAKAGKGLPLPAGERLVPVEMVRRSLDPALAMPVLRELFGTRSEECISSKVEPEAVERIARELAIAAGEKQKARVEAVWSALQGAGAVVEKPFVQLRVKK